MKVTGESEEKNGKLYLPVLSIEVKKKWQVIFLSFEYEYKSTSYLMAGYVFLF